MQRKTKPATTHRPNPTSAHLLTM